MIEQLYCSWCEATTDHVSDPNSENFDILPTCRCGHQRNIEEYKMTFPYFDEDIRQHIHEAWEERTERRSEKREWQEKHL